MQVACMYMTRRELAITAPAYALAPVGTRKSARTVPTEQLDRPLSTVKYLILGAPNPRT